MSRIGQLHLLLHCSYASSGYLRISLFDTKHACFLLHLRYTAKHQMMPQYRPELKAVGDKPGLEAQLAEAEAESRGWFEDEEVITLQ
jgi:hypothetical protein